jgi:hypothetical protein
VSQQGEVAPRYLTLEAARAIECNQCGDCCDSRRTDGYWTWGELPRDLYRSMTGGEPLIVPLGRVGDGWRDRGYVPDDARELTPTRFRCSAFQSRPDGTGSCGRHDQPRPDRCGEFPVGAPDLEDELREHGEVWLQTGAFVRCSWHNVCVVPEGDPRLESEPGVAAASRR